MNFIGFDMDITNKATGIGLVVTSAIVFSTAGLFIKSVNASSWDIIFWRGVFAIAFSFVYILFRRSFGSEMLRMGKSGLAVAIIGAFATGAFVAAFKLTSIANVTLIYAASPIAAALLAWGFVGERLRLTTAVAIVLAVIGVAIIFSGSLGQIHMAGDSLSLFMALAVAVIMVIYRAYPQTPAAGPAVLSSILLLLPGAMLGTPFANSSSDIEVLAVFGGAFAIASITLAEGARRIPATQTALLSILETPLAPLLGWLFLAEIPAPLTLVGGGIVMVAVIWAQLSMP